MQRDKGAQPLCRFERMLFRMFCTQDGWKAQYISIRLRLVWEWMLLPTVWKAGANAKEEHFSDCRDSTPKAFHGTSSMPNLNEITTRKDSPTKRSQSYW